MKKLAGILALLLVCQTPLLVCAQTTQIDEERFANMISRWNAILDFPERLLLDPEIDIRELEPLSQNINLVNKLALQAREEAEKVLERQQKILGALGPPPADTETPEAEPIALKRATLEAQVAAHAARIKEFNLIIARSQAILKQISDLEISIITEILGRRLASPLSPRTFSRGFGQIPDLLRERGNSIRAWWRNTQFTVGWGAIFATGLLLVVVLATISIVRRWLVGNYGMVASVEIPSLTRRFVAIVVETFARVILPIVAITIVALIVILNTPASPDLEIMFVVLAFSAVEYVLITGLARTALTSEQPQWRITNFTNEAAASLEQAIRLFAITIFVVNICLVLVSPTHSVSGWLRIANLDTTTDAPILVGMIGLIVVALASLNVLRSRNWRFYEQVEGETERVEQGLSLKVRVLFILAKASIAFGVLLYLIGYLNLAVYITSRTIFTLCFIALAVIIHGLVREGLRQATSEYNAVGQWVRSRLGLDDVGAARWVFWIVLLVDLILVIALTALLLNTWGMPWTEIKRVFTTLIQGAEIGGHTFSLINVGIALGAFVLVLLAIKLFQRFLSDRILVQTRLDVGVRDAVTAGVGYAGVVVAVLVALSLVGLKFGEIALIFSALSIGIGFGLQHVVNNFISGLILLVQRPIKAGDWIVLGQTQGYVKRINVISTEITTFDNATVIVPNSQLMTTEVMNWTHRGRLGRVVIPVGVSYASDPEKVRQILLGCAAQNSDVLSRPPSTVVFRNFGESSLDFELRVFIRDIDYTLMVASELRFAIKKALDEAGIEIPFPQRDVHVKNIPEDLQGSPA